MNQAIERFKRFVEAQRGEYGRTLPDKVAQAEGLWQDGSAAALEGLQRLAHTVYGSAGTYGFQACGEAARRLESAVQQLREGAGDAAALRSEVEAALLAFRQSLPAG